MKVAAAPTPAPRPRRSHPVWIALGVLALAILILALLFRWDWLRGPLARAIGGRLHRPVEITGHLEVHPWSWTPQATIHGLVIGNPKWAGSGPMAVLPRLTVRVKILPLLEGRTILPLVEADAPRVAMLRDAQGRANYQFTPPGAAPKPLKLPAINNLIIRDGKIAYRDLARRITLDGVISSSEEVGGAGRGHFVFDGKGAWNAAPFVAHVDGGSLAHVDPTRPYLFSGRIQAGPTRAWIDGRIDHPFDFGALSGRFRLAGPDLEEVYDLTGVALPNTPPYDLTSGFARRGDVFALRQMHGTVGSSDLAGSITVSRPHGRRLLQADLVSSRLHLADLVAVIGGAPKTRDSTRLSPLEQQVSAKLKAEHRLLPDTRLDPERLRVMDARFALHAHQILAGRIPMSQLALTGSLDHGRLEISHLDLDVAQGRLEATASIDARSAMPRDALDLRLSGFALQDLIHRGSGPPVVEGPLYAHARLTAQGRSVREAAAHANGAVSLAVSGGAVRQSLAELTGIDLGKSFLLLITHNKQDTPLRCAVADFRARDGVLQANRILADTGVVQVSGLGDIDLKDETMSLRFSGKPKKFRILRVYAPITLSGPLSHPKPGVDVAKAAPQVLGSVALGVLAAPAVALLPFIAPGLAKNADCSALLSGAR